MAKFLTYESWKLIEENLIDTFFPIGCIISNDFQNFDPNKVYPNTTWERVKGCVIGGINENDSDKNIKTSFNQKAGTVIGNKWLQSHSHSWVGVNDGAPTNIQAGNYPFSIYQDKATNWSGSNSSMRTEGQGDSENLQPTYLTYIWKRIG